MAIPSWRGRMDAVRAVKLFAAPPGAGAQEVVRVECLVELEDQKAPLGHDFFERFQHICWRLVSAQIDARDSHSDRIELGNVSAIGVDYTLRVACDWRNGRRRYV